MDQAAGKLLEEIGRQRHPAVQSGAIQAAAAPGVSLHGDAVHGGDMQPAAGLEPGSGDNRTLRPFAARWAGEAALLLERRSRRARSRDVHLPGHISASTLVSRQTTWQTV